ncbi:hypothetical protein QN277_022225 [Acacia crassicarpa]|uniref:Late embryogenesis abundant protein n=1 Tax=Acacia crassicarpa TaxID=499986 RepID=A0AAE1KBA1_9FABA|nr:hypothetical protein QN277_022225 [Acacia crassicarpa]
MAKISVNTLLSLISKRCYTVAAGNGRFSVAETAAGKVARESTVSGVGGKEKVFWMRDPKTGNWIPENHFGEIDVVELRNKYLSNAHQNKLITQTKT